VVLPEESSTDRVWAYSSALSTIFLRMCLRGILDSRVVAGMSPSRQMCREHKMGQLSRSMSRLGAEMRRGSHCEWCALVSRAISSGDWWAKTSRVGELQMIWQTGRSRGAVIAVGQGQCDAARIGQWGVGSGQSLHFSALSPVGHLVATRAPVLGLAKVTMDGTTTHCHYFLGTGQPDGTAACPRLAAWLPGWRFAAHAHRHAQIRRRWNARGEW